MRILRFTFLAIAILLFVLIIAVNLPFVHSLITSKTNSILEKKGIPVQIGKISFLINGNIGINELAMIPLENDTIIYAENIRIDVNLPALLSKKVIINNVRLSNATVNIITEPETGKINLLSAFDGINESAETEKDTTDKGNSGSWEISAKKALFNDIRFLYSDEAGGILVKQSLAEAKIEIEEMSLMHQNIEIKSVEIDKPVGLVGIWEGVEKEDTQSESGAGWTFRAGTLKLTDLDFKLDQPDSGSGIQVALEKGNFSTADVNLITQEIGVERIALISPEVVFEQDSSKNEAPTETKSKTASFALTMLSWTITNEQLEIENGLLNMYDKSKQFNDTINQWLPVKDLTVKIEDTKIEPPGYHINLSEFDFSFSKSIALQSGNLSFTYDSFNNIAVHSSLSLIPANQTKWFEKQEKLDFVLNIE